MRILVFGSSGQVAQSLAALSDEATHIVTLGRPEGDITDETAVRSAIQTHTPQIVINAAAYTAVDAAETDQDNAFKVNEHGSGILARVTAENDLPLIHYSTDYVFDGSQAEPYRPDAQVSPLGVYGKSKEAGERAIRAANPKHVILRTAWVFSPFGKNFVKTMLTLGKSRDDLNVVDDQVGNPSYAPDIAKHALDIASNILMSPQQASLYGTFHLSNRGDISWCGFATEIFRQASPKLGIDCQVHPIPSSEFPTPAKRPAFSKLDGTNLEQLHGVSPRHWTEALSDCIEALKPEFSTSQ